MCFILKNHQKVLIALCILFILNACKLQEPYNNHGIVNLAQRSEAIETNKSNINDVIKIIGQPHTVSIEDDNEWIYFERILTKGEFHKLGQNVLKTNNILVLKFDKFGILKNKVTPYEVFPYCLTLRSVGHLRVSHARVSGTASSI